MRIKLGQKGKTDTGKDAAVVETEIKVNRKDNINGKHKIYSAIWMVYLFDFKTVIVKSKWYVNQ